MHVNKSVTTYNILLLGETQSGKSTLLERFKQYADPSYIPNIGLIGNGTKSHTQKVTISEFSTNLPIYQVDNHAGNLNNNNNKDSKDDDDDDNEDEDEDKVENEDEDECEYDSDNDYVKLPFRLKPTEAIAAPIRFKIIDTPGLSDTNGHDIRNIGSIIKALLSEVEGFHLILIADNNTTPLTAEYVQALKTYLMLFSEMKHLIYVLHTRVPNNLTGRNINLGRSLRARHKEFAELMFPEDEGKIDSNSKKDQLQTKNIDCNLDIDSPQIICAMFNKIRQILSLATIVPPASLTTLFVHKPIQISSLDRIINIKYNNCLAEINAKYKKIEFELDDIDARIKIVGSNLKHHDTDELCVVYRNSFDQDWRFFYVIPQMTMEYQQNGYPIDHKEVSYSSVSLKEEGGERCTYWKAKFKRKSFQKGYFNVILSVKKCCKYEEEIIGWKSELDALSHRRDHLVGPVHDNEKSIPTSSYTVTVDSSIETEDFESLRKQRKYITTVIDFVTTKTLPLEQFLELADAGIYELPIHEQSRALEQFFAKKLGFDTVSL